MAGVSFTAVFLFCLLYKTEGNGEETSYGNIMDVDTTGASRRTATAERLNYAGCRCLDVLSQKLILFKMCFRLLASTADGWCWSRDGSTHMAHIHTYQGVRASETIATRDLPRMEQYRSVIRDVSERTGVDGAVIAGIISRESHAGAVLDNGWGDRGNGFGLMQVDRRSHVPEGSWNSEAHITQGANIFRSMTDAVAKKHPEWTREQQLKGGISAYNAGVRNVRTYEGMDRGTTGNDYANDVVARAKVFKRNGY